MTTSVELMNRTTCPPHTQHALCHCVLHTYRLDDVAEVRLDCVESYSFSELSIENWIMPMVYAGHVSGVAWLHPYWSQQIREGEHKMTVGRDSSTTTIRLTSTDNYFLSDGLYVGEDQLESSKPLRLNVVRVNPVKPSHITGQSTEKDTEACFAKRPRTERSKDGETSHIQSHSATTDPLQPAGGSSSNGMLDGEGFTSYVVERITSFLDENDPYILDIDMDFFSCKNPFKELYTEEENSLLKELYNFREPGLNADKVRHFVYFAH
ncbi:UPF0489 protein C5orf22 homolog [Melanotaenia boesemani]|uniref:UPF0489 protein C5orf22 homolog n=1 Tax=Melanotaenia boesemani TaxID=1250792 RepID=UPI001C03CCB7|nr:UPF0489 protein C5orf22 homolog [Melanotaenia boesemani]